MTNFLEVMPKYAAYKKSTIENIECIPQGWSVKSIRYAFKFLNSRRIPLSASQREARKGEYPYYGASGIIDYVDGYLFDESLILIAEDGANLLSKSTPLAFVAEGRYWVNNHAHILRPNSFGFIYWAELLSSLDYTAFISGAAQPKLTRDRLGGVRIPVPPTDEITHIANFLNSKTAQINQAISVKERQVNLLKEREQILIQRAVTRGLNPDAPMRDSGSEWIGEIPTHWGIMANRALFRERVEPGKEELPLLSVSIHSGVSDEEMSEDENIRGRVKIEDKTKYIRVRPGDIAFNMMRAWQGAIGAVRVEGMVSPAYTIAVPCSRLDARFFEYQYRTPGFIQQMDRYSKGITDFRKRLYWDGFKQLITLVPPVEEQRAIVEFIEQAMLKQEAAVALLEQQITKLKEYKSTVINSAVTGKIKVPGVVEPTEIKEREIA
ncbi:restriction endonuclease subunit S [Pseudomonas sp. FP1742]|uniref:restriction endonuclease subunit S n=1 Tax=Pseudomonas sp. FP1742 TaxID=2954079 RepID=UPI002735299C|nr:restriction endonuclease subunit S [Pseudomonas sp. FP1742]WLG51105.1 restriction endonuclease subunit S [Pseudomonas sp. FP1742]